VYAELARAGILAALEAGGAVLAKGGSSVDAVVAAVVGLEDCEVLNAGLGSVLTREGSVEMDAAVMSGAARNAGAVAGVRRLANPVLAARAALDRDEHILYAGEGAERLAVAAGLELVAPDHCITDHRRERQRRRLTEPAQTAEPHGEDDHGTVGAVALDTEGHVAAATSTGGMSDKAPGRVSDSCQIGLGTWADDETAAVSATGQGEAFMRCAFAHEIDAGMRLAGRSLAEACDAALAAVSQLGGEGGCVAIDAKGRIALPFDTVGMPRGWIDAGGAPRIAIHPGDALREPQG
jgi:L-asparaginase/beta-aspartyl-peptidase (threonine type)